jgi:hypothetical protein
MEAAAHDNHFLGAQSPENKLAFVPLYRGEGKTRNFFIRDSQLIFKPWQGVGKAAAGYYGD